MLAVDLACAKQISLCEIISGLHSTRPLHNTAFMRGEDLQMRFDSVGKKSASDEGKYYRSRQTVLMNIDPERYEDGTIKDALPGYIVHWPTSRFRRR